MPSRSQQSNYFINKYNFYNRIWLLGEGFHWFSIIVDFLLPLLALSEGNPRTVTYWIITVVVSNALYQMMKLNPTLDAMLNQMRFQMLVNIVYFYFLAPQHTPFYTAILSWIQYFYMWHMLALNVGIFSGWVVI